LVAALLLMPAATMAQTDYYNLDRGRPLTVEDPYPTERYALELQLATLRLERPAPGVWRWSWVPELAYGLAPRLQVELGAPFGYTDAVGERRLEVEGLEGGLLYQLLWESRRAPAIGVAVDGVAPREGPATATLRALATRTWPALRLHLNAEATAGPPAPVRDPEGPPRWRVGVAADRTWPLRSLLVGVEALVERPRQPAAPHTLTLAVGLRRQLNPFTAVDVGLGRRLRGSDPAWIFTLGASTVVARRAWIPGF
jgi:hypothetical protein